MQLVVAHMVAAVTDTSSEEIMRGLDMKPPAAYAAEKLAGLAGELAQGAAGAFKDAFQSAFKVPGGDGVHERLGGSESKAQIDNSGQAHAEAGASIQPPSPPTSDYTIQLAAALIVAAAEEQQLQLAAELAACVRNSAAGCTALAAPLTQALVLALQQSSSQQAGQQGGALQLYKQLHQTGGSAADLPGASQQQLCRILAAAGRHSEALDVAAAAPADVLPALVAAWQLDGGTATDGQLPAASSAVHIQRAAELAASAASAEAAALLYSLVTSAAASSAGVGLEQLPPTALCCLVRLQPQVQPHNLAAAWQLLEAALLRDLCRHELPTAVGHFIQAAASQVNTAAALQAFEATGPVLRAKLAPAVLHALAECCLQQDAQQALQPGQLAAALDAFAAGGGAVQQLPAAAQVQLCQALARLGRHEAAVEAASTAPARLLPVLFDAWGRAALQEEGSSSGSGCGGSAAPSGAALPPPELTARAVRMGGEAAVRFWESADPSFAAQLALMVSSSTAARLGMGPSALAPAVVHALVQAAIQAGQLETAAGLLAPALPALALPLACRMLARLQLLQAAAEQVAAAQQLHNTLAAHLLRLLASAEQQYVECGSWEGVASAVAALPCLGAPLHLWGSADSSGMAAAQSSSVQLPAPPLRAQATACLPQLQAALAAACARGHDEAGPQWCEQLAAGQQVAALLACCAVGEHALALDCYQALRSHSASSGLLTVESGLLDAVLTSAWEADPDTVFYPVGEWVGVPGCVRAVWVYAWVYVWYWHA